ncbi:diaminobutyrate acetyltransferase [Limibacillus halophilus]|uniref:L-2,4-diaminobutyric acid acetyltransferase n=1 Tax=Limibacillus halophilus TaxID=1579333 RepID=A0A839SUV3_9PROT|nr:diaminobutyrate acetyltransferase [Limibacillus halophilus]MBB3064765.1 L-2,4-diaminobutyric acid acetyltransferase [Limibacillus halophilus]
MTLQRDKKAPELSDARPSLDSSNQTALHRSLQSQIVLRSPTAGDGAAVNDLIERCAPLDENSIYCNLLQCSHFNETCVLAEAEDKVLGFVSGYLLPRDDETLFIWQVAVDKRARGRKLAQSMILELLHRPACLNVSGLQTTITPTNKASQALFSTLAEQLDAPVEQRILFDRERHFGGDQQSEVLWDIGPFDPEAVVLPSDTLGAQSVGRAA